MTRVFRWGDMSLNDVLAHLGYTTDLHPNAVIRDIYRDGEIVYSGNCHDVWDWVNAHPAHADDSAPCSQVVP